MILLRVMGRNFVYSQGCKKVKISRITVLKDQAGLVTALPRVADRQPKQIETA